MDIKILGTGCAKCRSLEQATRSAVTEMGLSANVQKEEDIVKIMGYGVMQTPALVINEKVILAGRVPSISEIKDLIVKHQ